MKIKLKQLIIGTVTSFINTLSSIVSRTCSHSAASTNILLIFRERPCIYVCTRRKKERRGCIRGIAISTFSLPGIVSTGLPQLQFACHILSLYLSRPHFFLYGHIFEHASLYFTLRIGVGIQLCGVQVTKRNHDS